MKGIEKITDKIIADAKAEANEIISSARAQADEIRRGGEAQAEAETSGILSAAKQKSEEILRRAQSNAGLEARKQRLSAKQALVSQAFDRAFTLLKTLPDAKYLTFLTTLAVKASTTGSEELIFSPAVRAKYGKQVVVAANRQLEQSGRTAALTLSVESRDIPGGLFLKNGRVEANCTLDTLLRLSRDGLSAEVAGLLFQ